MANNNTTTSTKGNKGMQDNNSVVTNGAIINGAEVNEKREQAVVLKYEFGGKSCTGVMHVSQFPSTDRAQRDRMFAATNVGDQFNNLEASVEPADKDKGRRFTSVRLSGRSTVVKFEQTQRQAAKEEREAREKAQSDAIASVDGKVVKATVKKLAFSKDPQTKQETDHCFGAFLKTDVAGVEVSGLLHTSRMLGKGRIERLVAAFEQDSSFEVVVSVTDKGVSFSEEGVNAAKEKAIADERSAKQAGERDKFLGCIREALAAGTAEKMPFGAKVTANRLDANDGISAESCGARVEVSSDDLAIPAKNLRGVGHQVKLVAIAVSDEGVITAKRYIKG